MTKALSFPVELSVWQFQTEGTSAYQVVPGHLLEELSWWLRKNLPACAGDVDSIPESEDPWKEEGKPQYCGSSMTEEPTDYGPWGPKRKLNMIYY